tara:strand:+ start:93 stop:827 length:735 start_codon:yes stop_codon:yes gene_type:complete
MKSATILKTEISVTSIDEVSKLLTTKKNLMVAVCNVNTIVTCYRNKSINKIINSFDIKCPDGFPIAKSSKLLYKNKQERVDGYNLFYETIKKGLENNTSHYFFGNTDKVTNKMISKLKIEFPKINIVGNTCPPFLNLEKLTEDVYINDLKTKNPDIIWVSLGFPKQEQFINKLKTEIDLNSNFVGIGAVFEWVAGTKVKAPEIFANIGLEWIFRLLQEPKRLYKRYFIDNSLFIIYFIKQYRRK